MKSISIILGILFLYSCSDLQKPEHLEKIKSLSSDLVLISKIGKNLSVDSIALIINKIEVTEKRMKENFQDDTLDFLLIEKLDSYKRIRPALSMVNDSFDMLEDAIQKRKNSIEALKSDIENGAGNRSKYEEYIDLERIEIEELASFVNYCDSTTRQSFKTFNNLHSEIEEFSFFKNGNDN